MVGWPGKKAGKQVGRHYLLAGCTTHQEEAAETAGTALPSAILMLIKYHDI